VSDQPTSRIDRAEGPRREPIVRARWQPAKLTFVEPALTKQGDLKELTGFGFFGSFFDGGS
jgi:hypothetical protein